MSIQAAISSRAAAAAALALTPAAGLVVGLREFPHLLRVAEEHADLRRTLTKQAKIEGAIVARLDNFLAASAAIEQLYLETPFATTADAKRGLVALRAAQGRLLDEFRKC